MIKRRGWACGWLAFCAAFVWAGEPDQPSLPDKTKTPKRPAEGGERLLHPPYEIPPLSPIFNDDFESGHTFSWDETVPPPEVPNCNCYFSGDCSGNLFCYWGPGGPFVEDHCNWRIPKPNGTPGAGCDTDVHNPGPICDGFCTPSGNGSIFGLEDPLLVAQGIRLWGAAILEPVLAGGGAIDQALASEAMNLPFLEPFGAVVLGRHVADMLAFTGGLDFYHAYCHFENHIGEPGLVVDLSGDPCRLEAAVLSIDALAAEVENPGAGAAFLEQIPQRCNQWRTFFTPRCPEETDVLRCVYDRILGAVELLTTPRRF